MAASAIGTMAAAVATDERTRGTTKNTHLTTLNDLNDDVLLDVLSRLPTPKFVVSCGIVCRRWYNLILNTPHFINLFVTQHVSLHGGLECQENSTIILSYLHRRNNHHIMLAPSRDPVFQSEEFSMTYLRGKETKDFRVLATCNDLLLCLAWYRKKPVFYVCNPFIKTWVAIPSVNETICRSYLRKDEKSIRFGLVCDPYLVKDSQGKYKANEGYRCRVVCITEVKKNKFAVEIFNPKERGVSWQRRRFCGKKYGRSDAAIAAWNGKLHWYNGTHVVAFDPFNIQTSYIDVSNLKCAETLEFFKLGGVCGGELRMVVARFLSQTQTIYNHTINGWKLVEDEEEESGWKWKIKHLKWFHYYGNMIISKFMMYHPYHGEVLYFGKRDGIYYTDMNDHLPRTIKIDNTKFDFDRCSEKNFFTLAIPWWPTPI